VVARILLGFGTCAGYPSAMYLIRSEAARTGEDSPGGVLTTLAVRPKPSPSSARPWAACSSASAAGGRTLAINVPLSLVCLVLGPAAAAAGRRGRRPRQADPGRADHDRPTTSGGLARALLGNRPLLATYLRQLLAGS